MLLELTEDDLNILYDDKLDEPDLSGEPEDEEINNPKSEVNDGTE